MGTHLSSRFARKNIVLLLTAAIVAWLLVHQNSVQLHKVVSSLQLVDSGREENCDEEAVSSSQSAFERASSFIYDKLKAENVRGRIGQTRKKFDLQNWTDVTGGGLTNPDRELLARIYGNASSLFEWGIGESTYIAGYFNIPRYAGIDSDLNWVGLVRDKCPSHFRFYFGDVGKTKRWGFPKDISLDKIHWDYQMVPLLAEPENFDVYMVDGRMRLSCALAALLHSSSRIGVDVDPIVLIHDYPNCSGCRKERSNYHRFEEVADLIEHSGSNLGVFKRKKNVTDEEIMKIWMDVSNSTSMENIM